MNKTRYATDQLEQHGGEDVVQGSVADSGVQTVEGLGSGLPDLGQRVGQSLAHGGHQTVHKRQHLHTNTQGNQSKPL